MFQSCLVLEGLDVEPEGGRDGVDVLPVELLQDCRLSRVVKPSVGKSTVIKVLFSHKGLSF